MITLVKFENLNGDIYINPQTIIAIFPDDTDMDNFTYIQTTMNKRTYRVIGHISIILHKLRTHGCIKVFD